MKRFTVCLVMFCAMGIFTLGSIPAFAAYYNIGGRDIMMDGYVRQEFSYNPNEDSPNSYEGLQSAYSILYSDISTEFGRNVEVRGIFRLWADMAYAINNGESHWDSHFRPAREELELLDNFDDIVRELYVTYTTSRFQVRVGRQQIGWGESDGLRLMDVVNSLDLRRGPFYDTQGYSEVRIPKWLLKTEYYPEAMGPLTDIALQLIWNPGDIQEQQQLQLPGYVDAHLFENGAISLPNAGGVWAVPTPDGHNFPFAFTYKRRTDGIENSEFGARLSFSWGATFMTFNFWHGFAHESLFKFEKIDYHPGGATGFGPVPLAVYADLVYPRVTYTGFTANREVSIISRLLGISTTPVLRMEALYSFDQDINSNKVVVDLTTGGVLDINEIYESDQIRYMVGFDWPLRMRWVNAKRNVFVSGQLFHTYTVEMPTADQFGNETDITGDTSPYGRWTNDRNQFYGTLALKTDYMYDKLIPSVLFVQDFGTGSRWAVTDIAYKIGDHWRPSIRYLFVDGTFQEGGIALYKDRDEITLRIQYQF